MAPPTMLPWRRRGDIVARPRRANGRGGWVLKDPVAQRYYTIREEEYFVWSRLTGATATQALCQAFGERFAPQQLSIQELQRFVGQLVGQGLVVADSLGSAAATTHRRIVQAGWRKWAGFNPLAIRIRGVDPDASLEQLLPWCRAIFTPFGVLLGLLVIVSALVLWGVNFAEFSRRWPEEVAQWSVSDVWAFAAVLIVVKVLHELGHALTCKMFGGEVHELGVLFLVLTPCLYCNVSDAWLLPSKWQRMAIGAAGMWVETVLSAMCLWLWWLSAPGWLHSASLQIVVVCGVSTLLFNVNPLLRYDGYYILSDWLDVQNLQQQSWSELNRHISGWLTGRTAPPAHGLTSRMRRWLPLFAAASLTYRVMMVFGIVWFLYRWLEPQGLGRVAQAIGFSTIAMMLMGPLMQVRQFWSSTPQGSRGGMLLRMAVLLAGAGFLLWIPLPCRIRTQILLEPAAAQGIYVTVDGVLERIVQPGTQLHPGDEIARLSNPTFERELLRVEGEYEHAAVLVTNLERRRFSDPQSALQLPAAIHTRDELAEQLRQRRTEAERLTLRAPQEGTLWPAPSRARITEDRELRTWADSPFDDRNANSWLTAGTTIGQLGRASEFEAVAYLSQRDVASLEPGQAVRLQLQVMPGRVFVGELIEVAAMQAEELTASTALRLKLPLVNGRAGVRLVGTWYQTRIRITDGPIPLLSHAGGTAAIIVPPRSLAQRFGRWLHETFPAL